MKVRFGAALVVAAGLVFMNARAGELKSGPDTKIGGAFQVKAITGGQKGNQLCYV